MGIYGALSTAVSGLRAQSQALENISGNIANSQTTGYKRIETDFVDLIPDAPLKSQVPGSVLAQSRATNNDQGDIKNADTQTFMALNGGGFFVVEPSVGQADGQAQFAGDNYYTRRGDFDLDKSGFLVNGAGNYLKGLPVDGVTGNVSGSVPEIIKISNAFLPAKQTSLINYRLNLPQDPKNPDKAAGGSGLLTVGGGPLASISGANGDAFLNQSISGGAITVYSESGAAANVQMRWAKTDGDSWSLYYLSDKNAAVGTRTTTSMTADYVPPGAAYDFTVDGDAVQITAAETSLDLAVAKANADLTLAGSSFEAYADGTRLGIRAKTVGATPVTIGGVDAAMFGAATTGTPTTTMWTNAGVSFDFNPDGSLAGSPVPVSTQLNGVVIEGINLGDIELVHGEGGVTQFADVNGSANVTGLSQNGYAAGEFVSLGISDGGRVVVSYSNNQQVEVYQVVTANFNAANQLRRMDGGLYAASGDSGEPMLDMSGGIVGGALESSNTDVSEEFTKLIITQQAYAAGTRIVSAADQMLQESLNMIR